MIDFDSLSLMVPPNTKTSVEGQTSRIPFKFAPIPELVLVAFGLGIKWFHVFLGPLGPGAPEDASSIP